MQQNAHGLEFNMDGQQNGIVVLCDHDIPNINIAFIWPHAMTVDDLTPNLASFLYGEKWLLDEFLHHMTPVSCATRCK